METAISQLRKSRVENNQEEVTKASLQDLLSGKRTFGVQLASKSRFDRLKKDIPLNKEVRCVLDEFESYCAQRPKDTASAGLLENLRLKRQEFFLEFR